MGETQMKAFQTTDFVAATHQAKIDGAGEFRAPAAVWLIPSIAVGGYLWVQMVSGLVSLI